MLWILSDCSAKMRGRVRSNKFDTSYSVKQRFFEAQQSFGSAIHYYLCTVIVLQKEGNYRAKRTPCTKGAFCFICQHLISYLAKCGNGPLASYVKSRVAHAQGMLVMFSPSPRVSDPDMHLGTCVTQVPWCMPRSLFSGFPWSRWWGKRSRHFRRMHKPQFHVSGKKPIERSISDLCEFAFNIALFTTSYVSLSDVLLCAIFHFGGAFLLIYD